MIFIILLLVYWTIFYYKIDGCPDTVFFLAFSPIKIVDCIFWCELRRVYAHSKLFAGSHVIQRNNVIHELVIPCSLRLVKSADLISIVQSSWRPRCWVRRATVWVLISEAPKMRSSLPSSAFTVYGGPLYAKVIAAVRCSTSSSRSSIPIRLFAQFSVHVSFLST